MEANQYSNHASKRKRNLSQKLSKDETIRTVPIEKALSKIAQSSRKDTLQTHPVKKSNKSNLVGGMQNNVTNQFPLCLYFVISTTLLL
jgi:hypothetical protein